MSRANGTPHPEVDEIRTSLTATFPAGETTPMLQSVGRVALGFFTTRTAFAFENPAILALGLADVKRGHAGRTASALLEMAIQDESKIGILEALAKHLHDEVDTKMVQKAVFDPEYDGICTFLHDDKWAILKNFAKCAPPPTLRPTPRRAAHLSAAFLGTPRRSPTPRSTTSRSTARCSTSSSCAARTCASPTSSPR